MNIISKEYVNSILTLTMGKVYTDEEMVLKIGTHPDETSFEMIINDDTDVYAANTGECLLRFRKQVISRPNANMFYFCTKEFMKNGSSNRGHASGKLSDSKHDIRTNRRVHSNVLGWMHKWCLGQYAFFRDSGIPIIKPEIRRCAFNSKFPYSWSQCQPFIQEIDACYQQLAPEDYAQQRAKADESGFKIEGTSFSSITVNKNFQTAIHTDGKNSSKGMGNLVVIEKGLYKGGYLCFPQYGIAVDVRQGDFLLMNVFEYHCNSKIIKVDEDAERVSVVAYLREDIWKNSKSMNAEQVQEHLEKLEEYEEAVNKKRRRF